MKNRFYTSNDDYTSITYKNDFRIKMLTKALRKLGEFPRKIEIFTVDAPDFYNEVFYTIDKNNQTFFFTSNYYENLKDKYKGIDYSFVIAKKEEQNHYSIWSFVDTNNIKTKLRKKEDIYVTQQGLIQVTDYSNKTQYCYYKKNDNDNIEYNLVLSKPGVLTDEELKRFVNYDSENLTEYLANLINIKDDIKSFNLYETKNGNDVGKIIFNNNKIIELDFFEKHENEIYHIKLEDDKLTTKTQRIEEISVPECNNKLKESYDQKIKMIVKLQQNRFKK